MTIIEKALKLAARINGVVDHELSKETGIKRNNARKILEEMRMQGMLTRQKLKNPRWCSENWIYKTNS